MKIRSSGNAGYTLTEIMIVVGIIAVLTPIVIPNFIKARAHSQRVSCINNIRQIDAAKQEWAVETGQTTEPDRDGLALYLRAPVERLHCPLDPARTLATSYSVGDLDTLVTCRIDPTNHILQ
jgi:prepilin-type N-terminal cleavage/methylation domain-containing protein